MRETIDRHGWALTGVFPTPDDPGCPFTYTIGLTVHHRPELIIAGLPQPCAGEILNILSGRIFDQNVSFTPGQVLDDLLGDGYKAVIVEAAPDKTTGLWPGMAMRFYGQLVRLQQVVWPDDQGAYPWDDAWSLNPAVQPTISRPPGPDQT